MFLFGSQSVPNDAPVLGIVVENKGGRFGNQKV